MDAKNLGSKGGADLRIKLLSIKRGISHIKSALKIYPLLNMDLHLSTPILL